MQSDVAKRCSYLHELLRYVKVCRSMIRRGRRMIRRGWLNSCLHNDRRNQVDLYVGKELVQRGIPNEEACEALIDLIKANDRWVEKEPAEEEVVAV